MPYMIAGIDVHKKMLAVVVADVEFDEAYRFERLKVGTSPAELRALADWLVAREVEGVVMDIDRAVLATRVGGAGWAPVQAPRRAPARTTVIAAQGQPPDATGPQSGRERRRQGPVSDPSVVRRAHPAA